MARFLIILKTNTPWERFEKIVLVQAVRTVEELTYQDTIEALIAGHASQLTYIPFVSREKTDFAIQGRVTQSIANGQLEEKSGVTLDADSRL